MVCITYCVYVGPLIPMICWIVENLNFSVQIGVAMTRCTNQLHPFFVVDYDAPEGPVNGLAGRLFNERACFSIHKRDMSQDLSGFLAIATDSVNINCDS